MLARARPQKNGSFKAGIKAMIRCAAAALSTHELKARRGARTHVPTRTPRHGAQRARS
jgi:hypothetical protein